MPLTETPHRRRNLLTGEWVLVSPHRAMRPWQGETASTAQPPTLHHDPSCHLCPGNLRADGTRNPHYAGPFVFANDFPALLEQAEAPMAHPLFEAMPARGEARVLCFAPDHALSLARMDLPAMRQVVGLWCTQSAELGSRWAHVQIFENRGAMMGASSPHPHGQVWAGDFIPEIVLREDERQRAHHAATGRTLLHDVLQAELEHGSRVIVDNEHWVAFVPFWAVWPFETLLMPRANVRRLEQLDAAQRSALSEILPLLLRTCDALFDTDFPYSMGWHGAPHGLADDTAHWRLHAHILPPLLRSATVRKHMVGFELLAEPQRDLTPEQAAARLRAARPRQS
ncbi:UDP-glucose--hexose-1-phosphate uridylyltransferase [Novosphingobium cyanobacteriorum]|uniref:Galactose-1-phosphate uridylyltransferase n=1 Tax=Novosphingobium cyanobacteriorum TaxID=3024215 RepID=A0ABT6CL57_9SPHN|nr:UDP-glucose--hexose-1-phosphate uridylyltransferase [Novosphingobium cyanobacteriorum]MDF8334656.1 UDP-glucose--hexose-1-phosphate uridylyltransferase [Novosphingobium cyanobacteriorum]